MSAESRRTGPGAWLPARRYLPLLAAVLLSGAASAAPKSVETGAFGVLLGAKAGLVKTSFSPRGQTDGSSWTKARSGNTTHWKWRCRSKDRCFASPARADFYFVGRRLAAADLRFDSERSAPKLSIQRALFDMEVKAQWGAADARTAVVGRRARYFTEPAFTVVWIQDGPDVQLKLYLDHLDPVGRAEAVAAGASSDLSALPGAKAYAAGHTAIAKGDWDEAIKQLDPVALGRPRGTSPLLVVEAKLVLAMTLAARAKGRNAAGDAKAAKADLARAGRLAPQFAAHFSTMALELGIKPTKLKGPTPQK